MFSFWTPFWPQIDPIWIPRAGHRMNMWSIWHPSGATNDTKYIKMNPGKKRTFFLRLAGSQKCPKSIQNVVFWSHVGPFLVSFRYTMGLELTFHNFHIHIRALDTRGFLLKNMVYHDNNKHIFWPSTSIPTLDLVETFASKPLRPWSHQTACATTLLRTHKYYYSSVHVYARVHTSIYIYIYIYICILMDFT